MTHDTLFGRGLDKVPTAFIRLIKAADSDWRFANISNGGYAKNVQMKHAVMLPRYGGNSNLNKL